jgi:hypothetical protein
VGEREEDRREDDRPDDGRLLRRELARHGREARDHADPEHELLVHAGAHGHADPGEEPRVLRPARREVRPGADQAADPDLVQDERDDDAQEERVRGALCEHGPGDLRVEPPLVLQHADADEPGHEDEPVEDHEALEAPAVDDPGREQVGAVQDLAPRDQDPQLVDEEDREDEDERVQQVARLLEVPAQLPALLRAHASNVADRVPVGQDTRRAG